MHPYVSTCVHMYSEAVEEKLGPLAEVPGRGEALHSKTQSHFRELEGEWRYNFCFWGIANREYPIGNTYVYTHVYIYIYP